MTSPRIVIDLGGLDGLCPGSGLFRYVVDFIQGLVEYAPPVQFVVFGAFPDPIPALAGAFDESAGQWAYHYFPRPTGRGTMYREQARLTMALIRAGADLYHSLHAVLPICAPCTVMTTVYDLMYELFPEYSEAVRSRPYRLYRWAVRTRARRVVCISRSTASDVRRLWNVPESRLDVVYPGLALTDTRAPTHTVPGVPPTGTIIVSPYNLEPRKNLAALVVAFTQVLKADPSARLVLYGRAAVTREREAEFDQASAAAGASEAIVRTGFLTEDQLLWLYRRATVFAFPSLYEGFGYPVLEAMGAGACVVARGTSAMAEVLGDTGLLVENASPDELASAVLALLRDDDRRAALGHAAWVRARLFTLQRTVESLLPSYERALGRAIPARSGVAR